MVKACPCEQPSLRVKAHRFRTSYMSRMGSKNAAAFNDTMLTQEEIEYNGTLGIVQRHTGHVGPRKTHMRRIRTTYRCRSGFR